MTEEDMDLFFIQTLKNILAETKDCYEYVKNDTYEQAKEIIDDYKYVIDDLTKILNSIKSIDDLAEMDENTIGNVYSYLEDYAANFVISADEEEEKKDLDTYNKLEAVLSLFMDEDEGDYDDDDLDDEDYDDEDLDQ